jgi:hypothetical protein
MNILCKREKRLDKVKKQTQPSEAYEGIRVQRAFNDVSSFLPFGVLLHYLLMHLPIYSIHGAKEYCC